MVSQFCGQSNFMSATLFPPSFSVQQTFRFETHPPPAGAKAVSPPPGRQVGEFLATDGTRIKHRQEWSRQRPPADSVFRPCSIRGKYSFEAVKSVSADALQICDPATGLHTLFVILETIFASA